MPAIQVEQVRVPVLPAYVPAAQLVQTDAPAAEYFPSGQAVQVTVPVVPAYLPAAQLVHADAPAAE